MSHCIWNMSHSISLEGPAAETAPPGSAAKANRSDPVATHVPAAAGASTNAPPTTKGSGNPSRRLTQPDIWLSKALGCHPPPC